MECKINEIRSHRLELLEKNGVIGIKNYVVLPLRYRTGLLFLCLFVCVAFVFSVVHHVVLHQKNRCKSGANPRPSVTSQVRIQVGLSASWLQGIVLIIVLA